MNFTEYNKLQGLISLRSWNNSNAKRDRVSSWSKQMNFKTKCTALLDGRERSPWAATTYSPDVRLGIIALVLQGLRTHIMRSPG